MPHVLDYDQKPRRTVVGERSTENCLGRNLSAESRTLETTVLLRI
jgi:hypothetical protein